MDADLQRRLATLDRVLAAPPSVHPMSPSADAALGVWSTEPDCYRLLAERCTPGARTLETGCGWSTVLFAALGTTHVCCTAGQDEADRVARHCTEQGIDLSGVEFAVGSSHQTLPPIEASGRRFDLVLVDGGHGFPLPVVDWFYAAAMLGPGGLLVVDDVHLPAVRVLTEFLDLDPRWTATAGTDKWRAWTRTSDGPLSEDWLEQPWYQPAGQRRSLPRRALGKLRRTLVG